MENKSIEKVTPYHMDDEIDLFELFASLHRHWRWWLGFTALGVVLSIIVALSFPKQYKVTTQVALPDASDVVVIKTRGYGEHTTEGLFNQYYQRLKSPEVLTAFIHKGEWLDRLFPEEKEAINVNEKVAEIEDNISIDILSPLKEKGQVNGLAPHLLAINMWGGAEKEQVEFLNNYVVAVNNQLIKSIKENGQKLRDSEVEKIKADILLLKEEAKKERHLTIEKLEAENSEKIKALTQKIELLTAKFNYDMDSKLVRLQEALKIATKMKIKSPTTIESMGKKQAARSSTDVTITSNARHDLFLLGSVYLTTEIDNVKARKGNLLLVPEISELKQQIKELKDNVKLAVLKERKNDDPFIEGLLPLVSKLDRLKSLTFDFTGAKLYRLDKAAIMDGKAEKPRRMLIVAVGSVLGLFVGVFVALIAGAVKRRKALA